MDKKDLKMYAAPQVELVEMELEGFLCESSNDENFPVEEPQFD